MSDSTSTPELARIEKLERTVRRLRRWLWVALIIGIAFFFFALGRATSNGQSNRERSMQGNPMQNPHMQGNPMQGPHMQGPPPQSMHGGNGPGSQDGPDGRGGPNGQGGQGRRNGKGSKNNG